MKCGRKPKTNVLCTDPNKVGCEEANPLMFHDNPRTATGKHPCCRKCKNLQQRLWRKMNGMNKTERTRSVLL